MRFPAIRNRMTGIVVPVAALRGEKSVGVGEFLDLIEAGRFCARAGLAVIQILPVNDSGFQSSPYSALTAFALHPLYLRIGDLAEAADFEADLVSMRARFEPAERFDFNAVLGAKMELLRRVYDSAAAAIAREAEPNGSIGSWIAGNPWIREYAVYRRLKDANGGAHWKDWPRYAEPTTPEIENLWNDPQLRGEHLFWVWLQHRADLQFRAAANALAEMGVALKGDLPILMNEDSCDVWAHPEYFRRDLSAGAPPDMFSPLGQNWQFPIYDWDALERDDFSWWRRRLSVADRYYAAYRIDHVLGFFRIWASSRRDWTAVLGRFIPAVPIERKELEDLGFDAGRIRWLSRPHVSGSALGDAVSRSGGNAADAERACSLALERIGDEDLWLFKPGIDGELDIEHLGLHPAASAFLQSAWRDRVLLEYAPGLFATAWTYWDTRAYPSLSEDERRRFEDLVVRKKKDSEAIWEAQGRKLLSALAASTPMLACAEDLGVVPDCVPLVLNDLGILGLRVIRWARRWKENGEPYIPLSDYPYLSVCAPAVHDSSTVREWWEKEADRPALRVFVGDLAESAGYDPKIARAFLKAVAEAESLLCVFQIQDLLHLVEGYYAPNPARERVNVPGTVNDFNWTYRLPAPVADLTKDDALIAAIAEIAASRAARPIPKTQEKENR